MRDLLSEIAAVSFYYILDDEGEPVAVDVLAWADWMAGPEHADRIVLQAQPTRTTRVSTVFMGLDHDWSGRGLPVLWETMIFGGPFDGYQRRYTSRLDALRGHAAALALVELFHDAPRRLKWTLRKYAARDWRFGRVEPHRLALALARLGVRA